MKDEFKRAMLQGFCDYDHYRNGPIHRKLMRKKGRAKMKHEMRRFIASTLYASVLLIAVSPYTSSAQTVAAGPDHPSVAAGPETVLYYPKDQLGNIAREAFHLGQDSWWLVVHNLPDGDGARERGMFISPYSNYPSPEKNTWRSQDFAEVVSSVYHLGKPWVYLLFSERENCTDWPFDGPGLSEEEKALYEAVIPIYLSHGIGVVVVVGGEEAWPGHWTEGKIREHAVWLKNRFPEIQTGLHNYPGEEDRLFSPFAVRVESPAEIDWLCLQVSHLNEADSKVNEWKRSRKSNRLLCLAEVGPYTVGVRPDSELMTGRTLNFDGFEIDEGIFEMFERHVRKPGPDAVVFYPGPLDQSKDETEWRPSMHATTLGLAWAYFRSYRR